MKSKWFSIILFILGSTSAFYCDLRMCAQTMKLYNKGYNVEFAAYDAIATKVEYYLTPDNFKGSTGQKRSSFKTDKRTPKPRAKSSHYTNSGYQRGHLCPAEDKSNNRELYAETFLLSNVAPMSPSVNLGAWKSTEIYTRKLAERWGRVRVVVLVWCTDSVRKTLPDSPVVIPYAFGKQVFKADTDSLLAEFYVKN